MAKFKLFDTQINGGLVETCETLYNGVPYSSNLNTGHKILVGLDIINTLSEHYGFAPMVFVDNAESITEPFQTRGQIIRLVASPEDKTLAVEYDTQIIRRQSDYDSSQHQNRNCQTGIDLFRTFRR
jgi:hypothetical protein